MRASVFFSGAVISLALSACGTGGSGDASENGGGGGGDESHAADHGAGKAGMAGKASNGGNGGASETTANGGGGSNGGNKATGSSAGSAGSTGKGGSTGKAGSTGKGGSTAKGGSSGTGGSSGKGGAADAGLTSSGGRQETGGADGGGKSGGTGVDSGLVSSCTGKAWPTANPAAAGSFAVAADKGVGPLAGYTPDPIYGDKQQRFNVYRPKDLATSGYCHPILIWANGHTDNPEPNPPDCVLDSNNNKWCGQYLPMMNHLASHGFVVVASLSTTTSRGDPLPTIAGLDWIIQQSNDSTSPYYHHLDTANIGQLGHSEGAMSTCMVASEPRYKALASICGTTTLKGVHTPYLFYCGGKDTTVKCSGVHDTFATVTDQPAFFIDELASDHGWWVYQGASGVSLSMAAAWFRVHLMGDTANRKYFYGANCTFCTDSRVQAEQNSLMKQ
jgi:hypothetical protein